MNISANVAPFEKVIRLSWGAFGKSMDFCFPIGKEAHSEKNWSRKSFSVNFTFPWKINLPNWTLPQKSHTIHGSTERTLRRRIPFKRSGWFQVHIPYMGLIKPVRTSWFSIFNLLHFANALSTLLATSFESSRS